jgi:diphosphomevalonate decarboxylase
MKESNQLHSIVQDAYPPIRYINDSGFEVIEKCHLLNLDGIKVVYTFDAGTNPFLLTLDSYFSEVLQFFKEYRLRVCN